MAAGYKKYFFAAIISVDFQIIFKFTSLRCFMEITERDEIKERVGTQYVIWKKNTGGDSCAGSDA